MALINDSARNQPTGIASLGQLSLLPPELRSVIWDILLFGSEDNPTAIFTLLRCNRYLYTEVHFYLYQLVSHVIVLHSTYEAAWVVEISFGKLKLEWTFKKNPDLQKYIDTVLRVKSSLRAKGYLPKQLQVDIHPSCSEDPGRIVCLWEKARDLSEMLKCSSTQYYNYIAPFVHVRLVGEWIKEGKPRHSAGYHRRGELMHLHNHEYRVDHDDHDIVTLPFFQLASSFDLPPQLWELISQEPIDEAHSLLYVFLVEPTSDPGYPVRFGREGIRSAMVYIGILVDIVLDRGLGETARCFRRDRSNKHIHLNCNCPYWGGRGKRPRKISRRNRFKLSGCQVM